MGDITHSTHQESAENLRYLLSTYYDSEDLINIGAYKKGSSSHIDEAIDAYPDILTFLQQRTDEKYTYEEIIKALQKRFEGGGVQA